MKKFIKELDNLYYATTDGKVFAVERLYRGKTKRIIRAKQPTISLDKDGYQKVHVYISSLNKRKRLSVHRLVLMAFCPVSKPESLIVNHINGIKTDNRLENLEWCDHAHNIKHAYRAGLRSAKGSKNGQAKLNEDQVRKIKSLLANGAHPKEICNTFKVSVSTIKQIKNGYNWAHIL